MLAAPQRLKALHINLENRKKEKGISFSNFNSQTIGEVQQNIYTHIYTHTLWDCCETKVKMISIECVSVMFLNGE